MGEQETPDVQVPDEPVVAPVPDEDDDDDAEPDEAPEGPETPEDEPEEEPESQAVMEEIGKKLDALTKTVGTRISTILGEHALDFEVCDLCSYWNTPGWRMSGHLPDDLRAEIARLVGLRPPSELKPDPHSKVCDTCDGEGAVDTHSKVVGQDALPCVECEGMGWLPTDEARRRGRLSAANGPTAIALGATSADQGMQPVSIEEPAEVAALRAKGYVVVPPIPTSA